MNIKGLTHQFGKIADRAVMVPLEFLVMGVGGGVSSAAIAAGSGITSVYAATAAIQAVKAFPAHFTAESALRGDKL